MSSDTPADRRRTLVKLIERELDDPRPFSEVSEQVAGVLGGDREALRFLQAKDDHHRHAFYVKSEAVWYRRFSWRIMRPLFIMSALAAIGFLFQSVVDPALGLGIFILGGVCVYLAIQYFAHRWMRQNEERLIEVDSRYATELRNILDDLHSKE
jgi:hypothetical protein